MFAKMVVVIVSLGVCACTLLALRQARLQAANELAMARLRVRSIDERISLVRTKIAPLVTPQRVEEMIRDMNQTIGPLEPIVTPKVAAVPVEPHGQPTTHSPTHKLQTPSSHTVALTHPLIPSSTPSPLVQP